MLEVILNEEYGYRYWKFFPPSKEALLNWWNTFNSPSKYFVNGPSSVPQLREWGLHLNGLTEFDFNNNLNSNILCLHEDDDSYLLLDSITYRWSK